MASKKEQAKKKEVNSFTKEQILNSKRYLQDKDLVTVLLSDEKNYTYEEVDEQIKDFMKGKVK